MAYGLRATGAGGIFQIDSSLSTTVQLAVHSSGTVAAGGQVTGLTANDIVFAHVTSAQYTNQSTAQIKGKLEVLYDNTGSTATFRYPANYIVLKATTSANAWNTQSAAGGYGLQVKNALGTVCFDSRYTGKIGGFEISAIYAKSAFSGGTYSPDYTGNNYSQANNEVISGTLTNKYVSMFPSHYSGAVGSNGELRNGFTFDYSQTPNQLNYRGFYSTSSAGLGVPAYLPLINQCEVIVGDLKI